MGSIANESRNNSGHSENCHDLRYQDTLPVASDTKLTGCINIFQYKTSYVNNNLKTNISEQEKESLFCNSLDSINHCTYNCDKFHEELYHMEKDVTDTVGNKTNKIVTNSSQIELNKMENDIKHGKPQSLDIALIEMDALSLHEENDVKSKKDNAPEFQDDKLLNVKNPVESDEETECMICGGTEDIISTCNENKLKSKVQSRTPCPHIICKQCSEDYILKDPIVDLETFKCPFCRDEQTSNSS